MGFKDEWDQAQKEYQKRYFDKMNQIIDEHSNLSDEEVAKVVWKQMHNMAPEGGDDEAFKGQVEYVELYRAKKSNRET